MSDLLSIGASGVRAYSRALQTVGDNVANAQTQCYVRRSTVLAEIPGGSNSFLYRTSLLPGGVVATGVVRAANDWLIEDSREAANAAAQTSVRLDWMERIERTLDDGGNGIGSALTTLFNRADTLASAPSEAARRVDFLGAVDNVASTMRRTADGLANASEGLGRETQATVGQFNADLAALDKINLALRRSANGTTNRATLLDERDRLIDGLATVAAISARYEECGAATISLVSGPILLDGSSRTELAVSISPDGRLSFDANGPFHASNGVIAGLSEVSEKLSSLRNEIDGIAVTVAGSLNAQHVSGFDLHGQAGQALFVVETGAASLVATSLSPDRVAAADASSSNGNANAFGVLRHSSGVEPMISGLLAAHLTQTASARAQDQAAAARREGANSARADLSGVDLDREAGELIRFQQAYEASARVLQAARETLQSIMNAL